MYGCESWTIKKAERRRTDAFELWCWRRLLRVPWTTRRSNQSILKEISPECSLEGLILKLKLQYFGHLMWRIDSLEKTLILGKLKAGGEADNRGWDGWMASPTPGTWVWASSRSWWWIGKPGVLQSMGSQRVGHDWATELNWTELIIQVELGLKWTKLQATQFKKLSKLCRKLYLWYIFYHIILLYDFVTLLYSILSINFYVVIHITSVQFSSVTQ